MVDKSSGIPARIRYFEGSLLAARDLQADTTYQDRQSELHIRGLHNTWGVALGFEVKLTQPVGQEQTMDTIVVGPGLAYDCRGRQIISAHTLVAGLPILPTTQAAGWWFDLVISYRELDDLIAGRDLSRSCLDAGIKPNEERPTLRWSLAGPADNNNLSQPELADDIRLGEEIPLARALIRADRQVEWLDFSTRRNAQGLVRPHIAGGQAKVTAGQPNQNILTWQAAIQTGEGGFSQVPYYFVALAAHPLLDLIDETGSDLSELRRILGPFLAIHAPGQSQFTLAVRFALSQNDRVIGIRGTAASTSARMMAAAAQDDALNLPLIVNWLGIEPISGCPPPLLLSLVYWWAQNQLFTPILSFTNFKLNPTISTMGSNPG
jgi:hypothetical protein